ncbi:unnamed protein product [Closterium sp. NIES-53]
MTTFKRSNSSTVCRRALPSDVSGNSMYGRMNRNFKNMVADGDARINLARNFFFGDVVLFAAGCQGLDVCEQFSLEKMMKATNNWSKDNVLGKGGFGIVYKGYSPQGQLWAIKRSKIMTNDFETEVVRIVSLNAAAIAAQFTADAGNLTTVNGQGLWINYNSSESAALLNAYSPAQRALMSEGASVGYDGTVDYPNGTTVAANGTVIFDPLTSPIDVDKDGNAYFANGTVVSANGTVSTLTAKGDSLVAPRGVAGAQMMMEPAPLMGGPADVPPVTTMPAPADLPPADMVPTDMPPNIQVDPIPGVMGGWGNWSVDAQQQWWGNATEWMNGVVPGLNVTASEYLAWLNSSSPWLALSDAMWEQAGSDRNVARVVRADLMDSAGMVVHGVDGVLFPHNPDFPPSPPKGDGGGAEGDVPVPIAIPVVVPGGVANDSGNGAGMNGTATGGQPDDSAAGGAGAPAAAGSSSNGSSSSSSGGQDASKSAASGTPAPPAGSPPAGKAQSKAAAVPLLLTAALSLVALL